MPQLIFEINASNEELLRSSTSFDAVDDRELLRDISKLNRGSQNEIAKSRSTYRNNMRADALPRKMFSRTRKTR